MDNVTHVDDYNKELVKEVHSLARLGVRLEESSKDCFKQPGSIAWNLENPFVTTWKIRLKDLSYKSLVSFIS